MLFLVLRDKNGSLSAIQQSLETLFSCFLAFQTLTYGYTQTKNKERKFCHSIASAINRDFRCLGDNFGIVFQLFRETSRQKIYMHEGIGFYTIYLNSLFNEKGLGPVSINLNQHQKKN